MLTCSSEKHYNAIVTIEQKGHDMLKVQNRFAELLAGAERRAGRKITYLEIWEHTGIAQSTLSNYSQNKITRFDQPTLIALTQFFECSIGDLLVIEKIEQRGQ